MNSGSSAGFGRRLAAFIYDALLLAGLLMIFTGASLLFTHGTALVRETVGAWVYAYRAGLVAVIAGYSVFNWIKSGQTLGMRAWHLRVVNELGRRLTVGAAALRFLCAVVAWTPVALGVLWLYLDPEHLALQDRLSRTRVVYLPRA